MAREIQTIITVTSDLSGEPIKTEEGYESLRFSWGNDAFEIDLTEAEEEEFRTLIERYVNVARVPEVKIRANSPANRGTRRPTHELTAMRTWARAHGWPDLGDRGRIPADAMAAYRAAHTPQVTLVAETIPVEPEGEHVLEGVSAGTRNPDGSPAGS